ncbi:MAG: response regulator [Deltaproteobacteria bacterium]
MKAKILLVDDEPNVLIALKRALLEEPYEVHAAQNGIEALEILKSEQFKVIISDERMPEMDGADLLSIVRARYPATVRIMLTGYANLEATVAAVNRSEVYRFFTKPWNDVELLMAIRTAVEKHDLEAENRRLLRTIKTQAFELKAIEKIHPGITRLEKDENGNLLLPDFSEKEIEEILAQCEGIE